MFLSVKCIAFFPLLLSINNQKTDQRKPCLHPLLNLFDPEVVAAEDAMLIPSLTCHYTENDWININNGTFYLSPEAKQRHGGSRIICECTPLVRVDDFTVVNDKPIRPFKEGNKIPSDFFEIRCVGIDGKIYKNIHSAIRRLNVSSQRNHSAISRLSKRTDWQNSKVFLPNVIIFGLDSVSRFAWLRSLVKSTELFRQLGGIILERFNVLGDGTPQNLLPLLTGKTETELPEARRGFPDAKTVDDHPWIWKKFQNAGYVTQWGEDKQQYGTFTYRMMGFDKQPTDHYMRPFYLRAENNWYSLFNPYCLGSVARHVNMLAWIKHFFQVYPDMPKFSFIFNSELTHDQFNGLKLIDDDLTSFLQDFNATGYLDNSILILMSDHGARYQTVRGTLQGKYEERLPFFGIRLPSSYVQRHPHTLNNLKRNAKQLTTPFDIYETLLDILKLETMTENRVEKEHANYPNRGMSLLTQLLFPNRTCADVDVAAHWCACLDWRVLPTTDSLVLKAALTLISTINQVTEEYRSVCLQITLDQIKTAGIYETPLNLIRFENSSDSDGRLPRFTDSMQRVETLYQITVVTKPVNASYEATLRYMHANDTFILKLSDISRTNMYGQQSYCISKNHPHLRPYCVCRTSI